jgi:hypothetical protein
MLRVVEHMREPAHLVLTFRHRQEPLPDQVRALRRAFGKLRRRPEWKGRVRGGFYSVEIKLSRADGLWHVHLHAVIDAAFIPQPELVRLWGECMDGGLCVWIRRVEKVRNVCYQVSKYVSKPPNVREWQGWQIRDWLDAVAGTRMIQGFGTCFGVDKVELPDRPVESPRTYAIPVPRIVQLAGAGVEVGRDLAILIRRRWPAVGAYIDRELPDLPRLTAAEQRYAWLDAEWHPPGLVPRRGPAAEEDREKLDYALFFAFTRFKALDVRAEFVSIEHAGPMEYPE